MVQTESGANQCRVVIEPWVCRSMYRCLTQASQHL